jgi:hypothetical protein
MGVRRSEIGRQETSGAGIRIMSKNLEIEMEGVGEAFYMVPAEEIGEFARLPLEVREDVMDKLSAFKFIAEAKSVRAGAKSVAALHPSRAGWSAQRLQVQFAEYRDGGDWRCVMNKAKAGPGYYEIGGLVKLPREFVEHWKGLCERNQRKCKPAYRRLLRDWRAWAAGDRAKAIPGYDAAPDPSPEAPGGNPHPAGWSYGNLMRQVPSKFELRAARIGRAAAADLRPKVFTTRNGLAVGQYYLFDDMWHDFKVNVVGQRSAQRLLQLHSLDLFSGCLFAHGMKPIVENEMTGAMERLKEAEMVFLVANVLAATGYRNDEKGTTLIVEHGTAAIREETEQALFDLTGGKVRVDRSGIQGRAAFAGMYDGQSKGNYRFKAALESLHNLVHNETADTLLIPGQTGSNARLNCPEDLAGREKHNNRLLKAMAALPPGQAELLRLPFLEYTEAFALVSEILEQINRRQDHNLEGWVEAGLISKEIRFQPDLPWLGVERLKDLSGEQQAVAMAAAETRVVKRSPREVFDAGKGPLRRLSPEAIAMVLGPRCGREVRVDKGMIEFQDQLVGPGRLRYDAPQFREGDKFRAVLNPMDTAQLYLFDAKGRFVGSCRRWSSPARDDVEALQRAMGRARKREAELLAPLAQRGAALTRQRIQDARGNARALASELPRRARPVKIPKGAKAEDFLNLPDREAASEAPEAEEAVNGQLEALTKL